MVGTEQAVLDHGADRRIPGHVGAREIGEKIEGVNFVFESRFRMDLGFVLRNILKLAVDRIAIFVGAQRECRRACRPCVSRRRWRASRRDVLLPCLGPKALPVSVGAAKGSKPSLVQSSSISSNNARASSLSEVFDVLLVLRAIAVIEEAGKQVDGAVMIDRTENLVEIDDAVEEIPGDVAHEGLEELSTGIK